MTAWENAQRLANLCVKCVCAVSVDWGWNGKFLDLVMPAYSVRSSQQSPKWFTLPPSNKHTVNEHRLTSFTLPPQQSSTDNNWSVRIQWGRASLDVFMQSTKMPPPVNKTVVRFDSKFASTEPNSNQPCPHMFVAQFLCCALSCLGLISSANCKHLVVLLLSSIGRILSVSSTKNTAASPVITKQPARPHSINRV